MAARRLHLTAAGTPPHPGLPPPGGKGKSALISLPPRGGGWGWGGEDSGKSVLKKKFLPFYPINGDILAAKTAVFPNRDPQKRRFKAFS
jgi:hypothetical protein